MPGPENAATSKFCRLPTTEAIPAPKEWPVMMIVSEEEIFCCRSTMYVLTA